MMIYRTGDRVRIFDAHGDEIKLATWCDTESGEVEVLVHDGDGYVLDDGEIKREKLTVPAPLQTIHCRD
jgi:hypothetical protein